MKILPLPRSLLLVALVLSSSPFVSAQNGLPTAQPKRLTIVREQVKAGRSADHSRHEAGWPAAYEKAKSPDYYIAMTSITGPTEAWYLIPFESYTAESASMKRDDKDPVLSAELERLALRDAEFISSSSTVQTSARTDLSLGKFPDVSKMRYFEVNIYTVRIGQEDNFDSIAKTYGVVRKRVAPDSSYRVYMVNAGLPESTYIVMSSVEDYAEFDRLTAENEKVFASTTAEEKAIFAKWGDTVAKSETNRFRLDPAQSYVSKEVRAQNPEFWIKK